MVDIQAIKNRFGLIGNSPALNHALFVAAQVANTDLTVLITGASGSGKESFSQIIHSYSSRKHNPFIAVNCGAIPEGTIDSELFGHEKGSFTGAVDSRKGYFETVNGGTIFLDEIGEMPIGTQARLLRILEAGEYIRVGSSKVHKTDVRVIAATNKDLLQLVNTGKFREDLYYRLSTVPIRVPSLAERKEDIHLLFRKFTSDFANKYKTPSVQLDAEAATVLTNYPWPGNIRELKNIAEQISVLSTDKIITADELNKYLKPYSNNRLPALVGNAEDRSYGQQQDFSNERELLYKLFFDMKKDVTELKKLFLEILQNPSMAVQNPDFMNEIHNLKSGEMSTTQVPVYVPAGNGLPAVTAPPSSQFTYTPDNEIQEHEEVDEVLNLMDVEKELIIKALKKHRGKRKDASMDLGISERTLYRKLKEYNLED